MYNFPEGESPLYVRVRPESINKPQGGIPKENGKKRLLGIPTVTDRMLQQAVHQIIYPLFEIEFKSGSYGFRPKRNAHHAVLAAQKHTNEGLPEMFADGECW